MSKLVVSGAKLKCSQGTSPATLTVLPAVSDIDAGALVGTVDDFVPIANVASFGMCQTQANPQVAAATAAAQGVLTPMPCLPVITGPWSPGSADVSVKAKKALTNDSKCSCSWTGSIEITSAGCDVDVD